MAIGDDALAAGMPLVDGAAASSASQIDDYINTTRDFIAQGKGATDAATAGKVVKRDAAGRAKFATPAVAGDAATKGYVDGHTHTRSQITDLPPLSTAPTGDTTMARDANGRSEIAAPVVGTNIANKAYVDAQVAGGSAADGPTSTAYARNAVGSGWFAVYMNSSLQFMRNTSSRRYKKNIRGWAGSALGLRTVIFDRRGDDTPDDEVGFIAEEVLEQLPEAVVYFDGKVDGISERVILTAVVADLQRIERRLADLERLAAEIGGES